MLSSHLEYLIAVRMLQEAGRGAQVTKIAEHMNVSPAYAVKLSAAAEKRGYVYRNYSRSVFLTAEGEQLLDNYMKAVEKMEKILLNSGADKQDIKTDAIRSVCALSEKTRAALAKING